MRIMQSGIILFKESIFHLREDLYEQKNFPFSTSESGDTKSCISTSFQINEMWDIGGIFTIHPSEFINITENYVGFISLIDNPQWVTRRPPPHRFGILLASLLAFITKRPVLNSVREDYDLLEINRNKKIELALAYPMEKNIEIYKNLFKDGEEKLYKQELEELVKTIIILDESTYKFIVEIIRVIQLSINIKSEDFGLAFSLLIQAIEGIAQKRFPELKKDGNKYHISQKIVDFIFEYCPISEWNSLLSNTDYIKSIKGLPEDYTQIPISFRGYFPSDLLPFECELSLKLTYKLRCNFVHEAEQPPHSFPNYSSSYFEKDKYPYTFDKFEGKKKTGTITKDTHLLSFDMMLAIAKSSIMKWVKTLK